MPAVGSPHREAFPERFLVFGEKASSMAELIAPNIPFEVDSADCLRDALVALDTFPYAALLAMSPMEEPGSAAKLIPKYRAKNPDGASIYHGWDCRIEVSGPKGLACEADFLVVGAILGHELLVALLGAVNVKRAGLVPRPPTLAWYEAFLRECFLESPFWEIAESFRIRGEPHSRYE